jgi:UDP-glucose 4-epimerase
LLENKILSSTELQQALQEQLVTQRKLGEILVQKSIISPQMLEKLLLEQTWRKQGIWLRV